MREGWRVKDHPLATITLGEGQLPRCNNPGDQTGQQGTDRRALLDMLCPGVFSETLAVVWSRANRRYVVTVALALWSRLLREHVILGGRGWGQEAIRGAVPACLPGT